MATPKITVIIPLYNTDAYLKQCLDSILSQDFHELEIICINDGSTDNSLAILQDYVTRDERIIIVNQENSGVSRARNNGLRIARGEYIFIPDSDDYFISSNAFSLLYAVATEKNLDIVSFDFCTVGSEEKEYYAKRKTGIISDGKHFLQSGDTYVMVWCKFYKRSYLDSIRFFYNETITYEDDESLPRLYIYASRVMHLHTILYAYRQHPNSIMAQKISLKHFMSHASIIATFNALLRQESSTKFKKYLKNQIANYLMRYTYLAQNNSEITEAAAIYKEIQNNLAFSKLELFLVNNESKFLHYTQVNKQNKFSHPFVYILHKFKKIFF